jgi:hypothetical protein
MCTQRPVGIRRFPFSRQPRRQSRFLLVPVDPALARQSDRGRWVAELADHQEKPDQRHEHEDRNVEQLQSPR